MINAVSTRPVRLLYLVLALFLSFGAAAPAHAQPCGPQWLPGEGLPGLDNTVYATTLWIPPGQGP